MSQLAFVVTDQAIENKLSELATLAMSIPEGYLAGWHESVTRYARAQHHIGTGFYNRPKLAGVFLQAMAICWREWPPQEK
jgi:hypothetical protein